MNPVHPWLDADEVKRLAEQLMRPPPAQDAQAMQNAGFGREFVGFAGGETAPATAIRQAAPVVPQPQPVVPQPTPQPAPQPPPVVPQPAPQLPSAPVVKPPLAATLTPAPVLMPVAPVPAPAPPPAAPLPTPPEPEPEPERKPEPEPANTEPLPSPRTSFLERIRQYRDWMHSRFSATGLFILDREGAVIFDEGTHGRLHFLARSLALASRRPGTAATNVHVKIGVGATLEVIPVDTPFGCLVLGAVVPDALNQDAVHLIMEGLVQTVRHPDNSSQLGAITAPVPPSGSPAAPVHPPG